MGDDRRRPDDDKDFWDDGGGKPGGDDFGEGTTRIDKIVFDRRIPSDDDEGDSGEDD